MATTDFSVLWTPSYRDRTCAKYGPYEDEVEEGTQPKFRVEPTWARKALADELAKTPAAAEALWESILALWRLKELEDPGSNRLEWRLLVAAWLVSRR
jgi:hypothetical protein